MAILFSYIVIGRNRDSVKNDYQKNSHILCGIFRREDGMDCGGVSTPGHGQGEGPARYEFRDSGTK